MRTHQRHAILWQMRALIAHLIVILSIGHALAQKSGDVQLVEFSQSACDATSDPNRLKPRIISLEHSGDTLKIEVGFAATCCRDYVPKIKYYADTLYLSYKGEGDACFCRCCYSFNHTIKGVNSSTLTVKLDDRVIELSDEKYWASPPTFVIVKGDTLNRTDKYGMKQGIWIFETAIQELKRNKGSKKSVSFSRYKDDKGLSWGDLSYNLKVKNEYSPKTEIRQEYYTNGQLKKECHETDDGKLTNCRRWKRNGKEIK